MVPAVTTPRTLKATLTGVRSLHPLSGVCTLCGERSAPYLECVASHTDNRGKLHVTQAIMCIPCVGRALEVATGWKVIRAFAQWGSSMMQSHAMRSSGDRGTRSPTEGRD